MNRLDAKVLMFPKVISEMPYEVISFIASWLERVAFTRDVHYLCFSHTERKSLSLSDQNHKETERYFDGATETSHDAVKSAALISTACNSANRQSYEAEFEWHNPNTMSIRYYTVIWKDHHSRREWPWRYPYLVYSNVDEKDWPVWAADVTFDMDAQLRNAIKEIGYHCCPSYIRGTGTSCETHRVGCNNPSSCLLHRYPRFMASNIAYQIVRLVNQDSPYVEDIPF